MLVQHWVEPGRPVCRGRAVSSTGPEFTHLFCPVVRCLSASGRSPVRYKRPSPPAAFQVPRFSPPPPPPPAPTSIPPSPTSPLVGGRGTLWYTYRYTVTTRMTPALRWAAMRRAVLMFVIHIVIARDWHGPQLLKRKESRSEIIEPWFFCLPAQRFTATPNRLTQRVPVPCCFTNSNSNSKTLFYKDCSLGSFKNLSNN